MATVQEVIDEFRARAGSLRCAEVCKALRDLGFDVRGGDGPGHKVVGNSKLAGFHGTNFDCGHGKNAEIKLPYVKHLARVLDQWKSEIEDSQ